MVPDPPPQPKSRRQLAPPFIITGMDFMRALYVCTKGQEAKVYICLFTCANTRAVHPEVVNDLSGYYDHRQYLNVSTLSGVADPF